MTRKEIQLYMKQHMEKGVLMVANYN